MVRCLHARRLSQRLSLMVVLAGCSMEPSLGLPMATSLMLQWCLRPRTRSSNTRCAIMAALYGWASAHGMSAGYFSLFGAQADGRVVLGKEGR